MIVVIYTNNRTTYCGGSHSDVSYGVHGEIRHRRRSCFRSMAENGGRVVIKKIIIRAHTFTAQYDVLSRLVNLNVVFDFGFRLGSRVTSFD